MLITPVGTGGITTTCYHVIFVHKNPPMTSIFLWLISIHFHLHIELKKELVGKYFHLVIKKDWYRVFGYIDNRISRYSMKMGKCEITGMHLFATDVHCHHYIPLHLGGTDRFNNLRILHKEVHKLIHETHKETMNVLINRLDITESMRTRINQYRKNCGLEAI